MARRAVAMAFFGLALWAQAPVALADGTPTLNPSLQSSLAPPPATYTTNIQSPLVGNFGASAFAATWGPDASIGLNDLELDGFVSGYGLARSEPSSGRMLEEAVMAFMGQKGAVRFLASDFAENKNDSHFQHTDPAAGLGQYYYGVHEAQASTPGALDGFEFVKGNDMFVVAIYAAHDDALLAHVQAQAKAIYDAAPTSTIPPPLWVENQAATAGDTGFSLGSGPEIFIGLAVVLVLAAAGVVVYMRQNELKPEKPKVAQQMTADGQYWWNGTYWIATSEYAPPWAQRSKDGAFWWDGHAWQAVPRPSAPVGR